MQTPQRPRRPIRARIITWTLAIVLVGLWGFSYLSTRTLLRDFEDQLSHQQMSALSLLKSSVASGLSSRLQVLWSLSRKVEANDLARPTFLYQALFNQPELLELFNGGLVMLDQGGMPLAAMPDAAMLVPPKPMLDALAMRQVMQQGKPSTGYAFMHSGLGAPVMMMVVPILNAQGNAVGALTGLTQLNQPGFLDTIARGVYGETGGYLLVDTLRRQVITASDPRRVLEQLPAPDVAPAIDRFLAGYSGSQVFTNPHGVEILASDTLLPDGKLLVAVTMPTTEAFAPIRVTQQRMLVATLALSLLLALSLWWLLERALAPVMDTAHQLIRMGQSLDQAQPLPVPSNDEIGDLVRSFNDLMQRQAVAQSKLAEMSTLMARTEAEVHIGSWRWEHATDQVTWSSELFRIFQIDPSAGAPAFAQQHRLYPAEEMQRLTQAVQAAIQQHTPYQLELTALRTDGTRRLCVAHGYPELNNQGHVTHLYGSLHDVTELRQAQLEVTRNTARLQALIDTTLDAVIGIDRKGHVTAWNPAAERLFGWKREQALQRDLADLIVPPAQREAHRQGMARFLNSGQSHILNQRIEVKALHRDGHELTVSLVILPFQEHDGQYRFTAFLTDLTQQHATQQRLQQLANVFRYANEGITITDAKGTILDVNDAFVRITGYTRDEAIGQNPRILKSGRQDLAFYQTLWATLIDTGHWSGEIWNRRKSGEIYPELLNISAVRDLQGVTRQYIALFTDITVRKEQEHLVHQLAFFDPLTALPNRRLLLDRLSQAMLSCRRDHKFGALMMLDLDNFKPLNDQHGHAAGDALLVEVARRVRACVREVDTVARLGGDEFVVVLAELDTQRPSAQEKALAVAEKIRTSLAQPYQVALGQEQPAILHHCSASIGLVLLQPTDVDHDAALRCADEAMYRAKMQGRDKVALYGA